MPEPHRADLYSFWRWEYLRRNKSYQKHYNALITFLNGEDIILKVDILKPPTEWLWSKIIKDFIAPDKELNKINGFVRRFHVPPFPYDNGPQVEELLVMAKSGKYDFTRSVGSLISNYQTDIFTKDPVGKNFDENICAAEYKVLLAWKRMESGYDRSKHRHLYEAICDLQMLNIANPKFHTQKKEMVSRAIGLYLWDKVERGGKKMRHVISDLEQRGCTLSYTAYSGRKTHTNKCITDREVLPFGSKT